MTPPLKPAVNDETKAAELAFDDNDLALQLFGSHHSHLARIEQKLDLTIHSRGNEVNIVGDGATVDMATKVLESLYRRLKKGLAVGPEEVDATLRMTAANSDDVGDDVEIHTRKRRITPRSRTQAVYVRAIDKCDLVFGLGPAGTGKTYLAMAKAVEKLVKGEVDRIILSRPAVEAGEQLGFLPGSMREKVDPYLRPLYDALFDMLPENQVAKRLESGEIEVAPLAFMRGRTLANAFVVLDEAQNTSMIQMKMFLTRLGEHARMVVTGDLSQVDLPKGTRSGLRHAVEILAGIEGIDFVHFSAEDVVRHPLVSRIVRAYDAAENRRRSGAGDEKKNHLVLPDGGNGENA